MQPVQKSCWTYSHKTHQEVMITQYDYSANRQSRCGDCLARLVVKQINNSKARPSDEKNQQSKVQEK
jgi:hypothetical protein